ADRVTRARQELLEIARDHRCSPCYGTSIFLALPLLYATQTVFSRPIRCPSSARMAGPGAKARRGPVLPGQGFGDARPRSHLLAPFDQARAALGDRKLREHPLHHHAAMRI